MNSKQLKESRTAKIMNVFNDQVQKVDANQYEISKNFSSTKRLLDYCT